jgi:diguanylate cyclase (GGDEF)-like protein
VRILVAEDDGVSRRLLEAILVRTGYDVVSARDGNEAWTVLSGDDAPRLAILDWVMPGLDGIDLCRRLRERSDGPYIYTILLTGRDSKEDLVEGMNSGSDDYITKPFDVHELSVRLRAGRRILELQERLLAAEEVARERATHDPLTGLWNREHVFASLAQELDRSEREGSPLSVVMADLDHFKSVNDTYGHMAGDAVLREAARRAGTSLRRYDVLGRYGGEEFVLVCPGCDAASVSALAERIRERLASEPVNTSEGLIAITLSLGTVTTVGGRGTPEAMVRAADTALYRAKERGRNRVEHAEPRDIEHALRLTPGIEPTPRAEPARRAEGAGGPG